MDPYEPPREARDARPGVILWYRGYAVTMALLSVALLGREPAQILLLHANALNADHLAAGRVADSGVTAPAGRM